MRQRKTEHPILMCSDMVRAILAGKKTETRRMAGLKELNENPDTWNVVDPVDGIITLEKDVYVWEQPKHPYGVAGDTLWVRETFSEVDVCTNHEEDTWIKELVFRADNHSYVDDTDDAWPQITPKWKPSLFMRKEQSRITLTVKGVTLERLHEITDEGARAEGITLGSCVYCGSENPRGCEHAKPAYRDAYIGLWKQLNGADSWAVNPWVWVVKFDVKEVRK